jgi:glycosyltransferase involved in cell wall biosynthesis
VKLAASVIVRNELGRYLEPCIASLLEFCDEVRILDDGSTDGWEDACGWDDRVVVKRLESERRNGQPAFYQHADARNQLMRFTLEGKPTHVLAVDADEFVSDGPALRRLCEQPGDVWSLVVEEVWATARNGLFTREDGGWRKHDIGIMWRPAAFGRRPLLIRDHGHATGRVPDLVGIRRVIRSHVSLLHFGWTNRNERAVRFERYDVGDGGKFHARTHIDSIMWPDRRVRLQRRPWPAPLGHLQEEITARAER